MVTIYKPNIDSIRQQARAAREAESKQKSGSDLRWGQIKEGANILRILPPTNSRGVIGKRVAKHFFNNTPLAKLFEYPLRCLTGTHPDVEGVMCPIHDAGDRILAQFPQLDIRRWHNEGSSYYVQAYDRQDPDSVGFCKIFRLSPAVYNWIIFQIEKLLEEGVDMTDISKGMDIKITRITKKTKKGKPRTEYDKTLWNIKGLTPLSEDSAITNSILNSMVNLDDIWRYPEDKDIAELNKASSDIIAFYMSQARESSRSFVAINADVAPGQSIPEAAPVVPATYAAPAQLEATETIEPSRVIEVKQPVVEQPVQSVIEQPVEVVQPSLVKQGSTPAPTDRPACFAGKAPRKDGGTGYSEDSEFCLMCKYELACMDACASKAEVPK